MSCLVPCVPALEPPKSIARHEGLCCLEIRRPLVDEVSQVELFKFVDEGIVSCMK